MFKKSYLKIGLVVVLLLTTFLSLSVLSQAAGTDDYTITVQYDTGCVAVKVYYNNGTQDVVETLQSGVPLSIENRDSADVTLELLLHDGYDVDVATDGETVYFLPDDLTYSFSSGLISDVNITVTTKPMVYDIKYIRTTEEGTANIGDAPATHTYNTVTKIPNPTMASYNFVKWLILPAKPEDIENFDPNGFYDELKPGNRDSVDLSETKFPKDGKTFYLYPIWTPKTYPVYALDVVYTGYPENPVGIPYLSANEYFVGNFPIKSTLSGVDVSTYVNNTYTGYYFDASLYELEQIKKEHGTLTVKGYESDADARNGNIIYRFYSPHQYKLIYGCALNGDVTPTLPEGATALPQSHVFNQDTTLSSPIMTGYHFAGWKVEVFDGNSWKDVSSHLLTKRNNTTNEIEWSRLDKTVAQFHSEPSPDYNGERVIRLTAQWTPKKYPITFDYAGATNVEFDVDRYGFYTFNQDLEIVNPIRIGYTFLGWTLDSTDIMGQPITGQLINPQDGKTLLPANTYTGEISLTARWQANTYTVNFSGNGADAGWNPPSVSVVFDQPFALPEDFVFPTRVGNDFIGFSLDAAGTQMYTDASGNPLSDLWTIASDTVLYAQWERRDYNVSVTDPNGLLLENATVLLNGKEYDGTAIPFKYGDEVTVLIAVKNDAEGGAYRAYKIVQWQGIEDSAPQNVAHTYTYTYTFTLGAQDEELICTIAEIVTIPNFKVDYLNENLVTADGSLPDGKYLITYGGTSLTVEVTDGKIVITEDGTSKQYSSLPLKDSAFGSQMQITVCGNGTTTADAAPITLTIAPRPAAPTLNVPGSAIDRVYQHEDTKIIIQMALPADLSLYEFAVSESNSVAAITKWYQANELAQPSEGAVMFENLKPGTQYYVFVRIKAVDDNSPHGDSTPISQATNSNTTLTAKKNELTDMILPTDGEMLKTLINQAIAKLDELAAEGPTTDFEARLNEILAMVSPSQVAFARKQDSLIADLTALYTTLANSNQFSESGKNELNAYYTVAVSGIKAATSADVAQSAYDVGRTKMLLVPITHLYDGNIHLISQSGLPQGVTISQLRFDEISDLIAAVKTSMESNTVAVNGTFMTLEQAQEMLDSLELLASYSMELQQNGVAYTMYDGIYEIRLVLPTDLLDQTGLQVGYFDEKTGVITLLETKRVGNELVFYADTVEDFLILGDSTFELTGLLIALSVILLLQLAAIILLLVRRTKNSKLIRMNGFAPIPAMLAVRFLPENSLTILLILSALVVIFQIVLIYLLVTSDLFHRSEVGDEDPRSKKKRREDPETSEAAQPVEETVEAVEENRLFQATPETSETLDEREETEAVEDSFTDSEKDYDEAFLPEEAAAMLIFDEQTADGEDNEDVQSEEGQLEEDDLVAREFDPEFDTDDFIEPAPNPYYSLEEEQLEIAPEALTYDEDYLPVEEELSEDLTDAWEDAEASELADDDIDLAQAVFAEDSEGVEAVRFDPETGEVFEDSDIAQDASLDEEVFADLPEEELLPEEDAEVLAEEEAVEMVEDEIYVEPDITGDEAPAPEGFYGEDASDSAETEQVEEVVENDPEQKYNGYEE